MPNRIPIYAKVIILFGLNLLLVGAIVVVAIRQQLSEELDTVLGRQVSERLTTISRQIRTDVEDSQKSSWDEALDQFSREHHVAFYLFNVEGEQLAGNPIDLPIRVQERLRRRASPGGPPRQNVLPPRNGDRPPPRDRPDRPRLEGMIPEDVNFFIRSARPGGYWFGSRMPVATRGESRPDAGVMLARADSLFGAGVLIDLKPWVLFAGAVFAMSSLLWLPLVKDLTGSVRQITNATEQMANGQFDVAVNDRRRDELGRLGTAINQMSSRLAGFVSGQKRFLGDTAHELCAPIARMQMALGILEQRADETSRAYVRDVHEDLQHMSHLVNELLSLSKAGLSQQAIELSGVNLAPLIESIAQRDARNVGSIDIVIPENTLVMADSDLLGRAVSNIVRNSIRYGGESNHIVISARTDDDRVTLSIEDSGPGVPEGDLPKLFDPFFRVDTVRTPGEGGAGLGLAIVHTCVTACNATVTAENVDPRGLRLNLTFTRAVGTVNLR